MNLRYGMGSVLHHAIARETGKPDRRADRRRQDDVTKQRIAEQMRPLRAAAQNLDGAAQALGGVEPALIARDEGGGADYAAYLVEHEGEAGEQDVGVQELPAPPVSQ